MQTELGVDAPDGLRRCGYNGCRVWMVDDDRPWCEVCKLKREPYVVVRDGRWVWVEGEKT